MVDNKSHIKKSHIHIKTTKVISNNASKQTTIPNELLGTIFPPKDELEEIEWEKQGDKIVVKPNPNPSESDSK